MGTQGRQLRKMESRERLSRDRSENRLHLHAGGVRRLPVTRRICRAGPAQGRKPRARQQWCFSDGLYEIQVLDSYENKTYADGQVSAIYGQYPPLVNASRPPGQWQTYDIVFHGPRFDKDGKLLRPARETVFHNGVLVQDNVELSGPTAHGKRPPYEPQPEKLPLALQDHSHPVRYRNIWIRELKTPE